jgi:hypothetical protein
MTGRRGESSVRKTCRRVLEFAALLLTASLVRCDQRDPAGPAAALGPVILLVASPRGPEGAALIEIDGHNVTALSGSDGMALAQQNGNRLRIALLLARPGVPQLTVTVTDTTQPLNAVLLEVADSLNVLRPSLQGYSLLVAK